MKIRMKGSAPYFFEADDTAAKELIARGDYEEHTEKEERAPVAPLTTDTGPGVHTKPTKRGKK